MLHEAGRKEVEKAYDIEMDRLFLNPKVMIEMVTPAHYANWPNAFEQVWPIRGSKKDAEWRKGWMKPELLYKYVQNNLFL